MTSNYITCMPFSAGAENQQTLCYQPPAEEICHGAISINLFHILSVGLKSTNSVQLPWNLSNQDTSGEAQGWRMPGRAICLTGGLCLTPPFLSSLVSQPCFFDFIERCSVAEEFDGEPQVLSICFMPLSTWINISSPDHFFSPLHLRRSPGGVRWVLEHVPMLWSFINLFLQIRGVGLQHLGLPFVSGGGSSQGRCNISWLWTKPLALSQLEPLLLCLSQHWGCPYTKQSRSSAIHWPVMGMAQLEPLILGDYILSTRGRILFLCC